MPRSYSQAMAEATEGSPGDFIYFIAGFIIFNLYKDIWRKIKTTPPNNVMILLATIITLIVLPLMLLFYIIVFFFVWAVGSSILDAIKKHKENLTTPFVREHSETNICPMRHIGNIQEHSGTYLCPMCHTGNLRRIEGRNGSFWGCGNYPRCTATFDDINGRPNIATSSIENTKEYVPSINSQSDSCIEKELSSDGSISSKMQFTPEVMNEIEELAMQEALKTTEMTDWDIAYMEKYNDKDKRLENFYRIKRNIEKSIINGIIKYNRTI